MAMSEASRLDQHLAGLLHLLMPISFLGPARVVPQPTSRQNAGQPGGGGSAASCPWPHRVLCIRAATCVQLADVGRSGRIGVLSFAWSERDGFRGFGWVFMRHLPGKPMYFL